MPFTIDTTDSGLVVELDDAVTIWDAKEMAAQLTAAMDDGLAVTLRTAGVTDVDTSILQVLCSLRKSVAAFSFESLSDAFSAAVDRSGLRRELLGGLRDDA